MIAQIEGKLVRLDTDSALVKVGAITYELMLPSYCINILSGKIGTDVKLYTMEYYEGTPGGGNLIPRMIGFSNITEKEFFNKFISVKGIGIKKGLKSLSIPISTIATAIESSDDKILTALPGLGKRMVQQIIAELKGKVQAFAIGTASQATSSMQLKPFQIEALEILIAWGEKRNEAMELIELTCKKHPEAKSAEMLVPLVYRLKQGTEV